jgi:glutaredoxin
MEFLSPVVSGFTVYSKSGCINCTKIKNILKDKKVEYKIIDCDEYLLEDKSSFLLFIKEQIKQEYNTFPMVFHEGLFIGGYKESKEYIEKKDLSFDDL